MADYNTNQTGIKSSSGTDSITDYALFLSGPNVTRDVLYNYDPLKTGYARIFMIRQPVFLQKSIPTKLKKFKHILEYGNTAISGFNDVQMNFNQIQSGYSGKTFEIPSYASDDMTSFQIKVYEFSGSPIREVLHSWINGVSDLQTGLTHYNGVPTSGENGIERIQANQTAEFIYVETDSTGEKIEYACLFANCFPKNIPMDQFNYTAGEHNLVEMDLEFTCTKYESIQINSIATKLISAYRLLGNSLNFNSGIKVSDVETLMGRTAFVYNIENGKLEAPKTGQTSTDVPTNPDTLTTGVKA